MNKNEIISIINPENEVEIAISINEDFIDGCDYGKPRPGHIEGKVIYHIKEVLENIDKHAEDDEERRKLRLIALFHDTFKHKVDRSKPKFGDNHHGMIARRFAEQFIPYDKEVLQVIEHHDDAYNAWSMGDRKSDWSGAENRVIKLIDSLVDAGILELYLAFYYCDNNTGDKTQDCYIWFVEQLA